MKKYLFRIAIIFIALFSINVHASEIDLTKPSNVQVKYSYSDKVFANQKAYLYKIADIGIDNTITYTEDFKNLTQSLENLTASQFSVFATTVGNQITQKQISHIEEQITNAEGIAEFNNLTPAVYFIKMDTVTQDDYQYRTVPTVITAPLYNESEHQYKYEFSVMMKTEAKYIGEQSNNGNTTEIPNTVDDIMIYAAIFAISLIIIGVLVCYINKIKKEGKEKNEESQ